MPIKTRESAAPPILVGDTNVTPIATVKTISFSFKTFGMFKVKGTPTRLDVRSPDGTRSTITIADRQAQIISAIKVTTVILIVVFRFVNSRRGS